MYLIATSLEQPGSHRCCFYLQSDVDLLRCIQGAGRLFVSWFLHLKEVCYGWCCVRLSSVLILCSSCPAESKAVYLFLRSPVYYLEYLSCADLNWTEAVSIWIDVILKYKCHQDLSKAENWDINNWRGVNKNQGKALVSCVHQLYDCVHTPHSFAAWGKSIH